MIHISQINPKCIKLKFENNLVVYPCSPDDKETIDNLVDTRVSLMAIDESGFLTFIKKLNANEKINIPISIEMEYFKNIDTDGRKMSVDISVGDMTYSGYSHHIISCNTHNIYPELEEDLEQIGIDVFEIQEMLENNESVRTLRV